MLMKNIHANQDKRVLVPRSIISADFWVLTWFPGSSGFVSSHLCGPPTLHHCRLLIPHLRAAHALFTSHSSPSSLMLLFVELNIEKIFALLVHSIYISCSGLISGQPVELCWFQVYPLCKQQVRRPSLRFDTCVGEYWWVYSVGVSAPLVGRLLNCEAVFFVLTWALDTVLI